MARREGGDRLSQIGDDFAAHLSARLNDPMTGIRESVLKGLSQDQRAMVLDLVDEVGSDWRLLRPAQQKRILQELYERHNIGRRTRNGYRAVHRGVVGKIRRAASALTDMGSSDEIMHHRGRHWREPHRPVPETSQRSSVERRNAPEEDAAIPRRSTRRKRDSGEGTWS